tara:strand:+ start:363 stop:800 length:438 start_codon:yes stop_codon:yes gene_type:complete
MRINIFYILIFCFFIAFESNGKENFFEEAKKKYEENNLEDSKFLFQRNIVFNPKNAESYLFLAKIYNSEKNEKEEIKNLETTLLLEPQNEEALFMLIEIGLEKSNFSEVKDLKKKFQVICKNLCDNIEIINERLKDIEAKNESVE